MSEQVPAAGPKTARIALIGEAPGKDEVRKGEPFVGKAGKKLDAILSFCGLQRSEIYITNVVKENPPNNDISTFFNTPAYDAHEQALYEELEHLDAAILIPLGNVALWALTRQWGITKRRGSIYPYGETRRVIPTFHPASALPGRQPINQWIIQTDLRRARVEAENPIPPPKHTASLRLHPPFEETLAYLEACRGHERVGFDTEASVQKDGGSYCTREMVMFSVAKGLEDAVAVPLITADGQPCWTLEQETEILLALARLLEDAGVKKVIQNAMYDAPLLYHRYGVRTQGIDDTMIASGLLTPDLDKDLGFLCSIYTRVPYYKDAGPKFWKAKGGDWGQFLRYSALDAAVLMDIWPKLEEDLEKMHLRPFYDQTIHSIHPLLCSQEVGIPVDVEGRKSMAASVRKEITPLRKDLDALWLKHKQKDPGWVAEVEAVKKDIEEAKAKGRGTKGREQKLHRLTHFGDNARSSKQKIEWFYDTLGERKPAKDPTDNKAIKRMAARGVPGASLVATITQAENDLSKYWTAPIDADGRARCSWQLPGTWTGRFSCRKGMFGTGFQFQNMPDRLRDYLHAPSGCVFLEIDYSQIENRLVAYFAREEKMIEAFETGVDLHCLTAALIFNKSPEEVSKEKGSCPLGDGLHSERDWGKRANHSLNYGLSWKGFMERFEVDAKTAKFVTEGYHSAYPNIRNVFWKAVERDVKGKRTLVNMFGRPRYFLGFIDDETLRQATAYPAQSVAPHLVNGRMLFPLWDAAKTYPDAHIFDQIHDSLWITHPVETPEERNTLITLARWLKSMAEEPLEYEGRSIQVPVEMKVGATMGGAKEVAVDDLEETLCKIMQ